MDVVAVVSEMDVVAVVSEMDVVAVVSEIDVVVFFILPAIFHYRYVLILANIVRFDDPTSVIMLPR